ncbi:hypothetical protein ALC57_02100, partial [Trachymyrmex cornetzi]
AKKVSTHPDDLRLDPFSLEDLSLEEESCSYEQQTVECHASQPMWQGRANKGTKSKS